MLGRIAWIAGRLGIAPPVTRLVRSPSALQKNNALIAGLAAPTMVLYDGILYRLTEEERDAIIAHELAHLANHTFWYWLVAGAACGVASVAASAFYPLFVALGLGLVLLTGAWLILSRRLELDCDRRAARAIGHRRAASALWKIHADQPFRGLIEFLIGAVGTHPSRDERLAAIRRDAPNDDRPEVEWDSRLLRRRRLAAWGAAGLWLAVIVACLLWGYRSPGSRLAGAAAGAAGGGSVRVVLAGAAQDRSPPAPPPADAARLAEATGLAGADPAGGLPRRPGLRPDQPLPERRGELCHPGGRFPGLAGARPAAWAATGRKS